jgi:hypothetical protein
MNQERVTGFARERKTGNTLFYSFLGRGGEEEKDVCEALITPEILTHGSRALQSPDCKRPPLPVR